MRKERLTPQRWIISVKVFMTHMGPAHPKLCKIENRQLEELKILQTMPRKVEEIKTELGGIFGSTHTRWGIMMAKMLYPPSVGRTYLHNKE
ncbi:hypothetical protein AVEN_112852-1 [Araneus ventricosus]|uniref:Uncharacterized protein n=1 Tax=Araneus ventricosus TaxID=182803 RepID=A0A4Y2U8J5_ARAVE|nr:hypothetical protein AVEN_112852-1 [Araneus ventricosus]